VDCQGRPLPWAASDRRIEEIPPCRLLDGLLAVKEGLDLAHQHLVAILKQVASLL